MQTIETFYVSALIAHMFLTKSIQSSMQVLPCVVVWTMVAIEEIALLVLLLHARPLNTEIRAPAQLDTAFWIVLSIIPSALCVVAHWRLRYADIQQWWNELRLGQRVLNERIQKREEQILRFQAQETEQMTRTFLTQIAHEMKNPVAGQIGALEELLNPSDGVLGPFLALMPSDGLRLL